jgi:hypothetical protein
VASRPVGRRWRGVVLAGCFAGCLLAAYRPAWACSVPVFRYALDRWPADDFGLVVVHRGPLTPEQGALIDRLRTSAAGPAARINLTVRAVDVALSPTERSAAGDGWSTESGDLPRLVLRFPERTRIGTHIWSGPLDTASVGALLDSPTRRQIVSRLVDGESAVWVLLESGHVEKDEAAAELLKAELARLQQTLELPDPNQGIAYEPVAPEVVASLKITFSTLRLARTDQAERVLVSMLLGTEPDLHTYREPMVFPIFGRGRVLYALVGEGINRENISQAADYLVGACSCLVKAENPGLDLLILADWDVVPDVSFEPAPPPEVVGLPDLSVSVARPADAPRSDHVPSHGRPVGLLGNAALAAVGVALLSGVLFFWLRKRRVN